jgi:hypothetical protein
MRAAITAGCHLYRVMLYAYPRRLRAEFGEDMISVFEQQLLDAHNTGGLLEVGRIWARALWETAQFTAISGEALGKYGIARYPCSVHR